MTKPKPTKIFSQLAQVADRIRQGKETPDDLILIMRHPFLTNLIVKFKVKK